jgi:ATP-binding cassette subfamily B protein
MSFVINPEISYTFLIVVPVLILGLGIMMLLASKHFRMMFKKYDQLNTVVEENSQAQRTVKSFVNEEYEKKKFANSSEAVYYYSMKAENVLAFNNPLMQLAVHFCIIIICFLGGTLFYNGKLSAGDFSALVAFVMQILGSLMMISFVIVMISMARSSAQRIREVLNEEPTIKNNDKALTEVKNGDIDFNDVNFSYSGESTNEEKLNLVHINLHIKSGEVVGIIGGTGSSKSTLVNLIPRLYDVTSGELKVAGENVKDYDVKTLRDNVSVVLQKNVLFTGSILDNLRWGNENATDEELIHAAKLAQADEFIQTFPDKYNSHIDQGGANVSGGQRQRLCIARALVKKPRILILDDSTSAVDTKTDALIRKAFKEEIPETTKIIIAQRISSVEDCDHIIVLYDGQIND